MILRQNIKDTSLPSSPPPGKSQGLKIKSSYWNYISKVEGESKLLRRANTFLCMHIVVVPLLELDFNLSEVFLLFSKPF